MTGIRPISSKSLQIFLFWAFATPALADWGWIERDIPPDIGGTIGSFGGAATHSGTEVFWSGQADGLLASTWTHGASGWDGGCGTPGGPGACPQGVRIAPGVADGPAGVLLFGGQGGELGSPAPAFGDTWQLEATGWQQVCDTAACGPGERAGAAMAGNGVFAVLYGGTGGAPFRDDTWVYDGTGWTQVCGGGDPCGPGQLVGATLVWDGAQFVLFGGLRLDGPDVAPVDATWTFDVGTGNWTEVCGGGSPCGPSPRAFPLMATSGGGEAALLGGFDLDGGLGFTDAWRWNGSAWSAIDVPWSTTPTNLDDPEGCAVIPTHLAPRDNGVVALVAVFGSPRFGEEGGLLAVFGGEEPGGVAAGDPCVALPASITRPVPALGNGLLALLSGLLLLVGLNAMVRDSRQG